MNLSEAIGLYLSDRKARGMAANTVRNEKTKLQLLLADVGNVQTQSLRPQHIDLYWSRRTTWGPGTMNNARICLTSFIRWCQARGHIRSDMVLMPEQRRLREPPRKRIIIPQADFATFLDGIKDPRTRVMCAIGLYLFTRISETAGLRWQDVNMHDGVVSVFRKKTQTLDDLPLCDELRRELQRWALTYAAEIGRPLLPSDFVIPALKPARAVGVPGKKSTWMITEQRVLVPTEEAHMTYSIKVALKDAGFYQEYEGGHTLRRSGAVALYNQLTKMGHDRAIRLCQAMLGHTHIRTTEVYLRLDLDRKVRNDLLAGKPMFPEVESAEVIQLKVAEGDA
jgi:integrase